MDQSYKAACRAKYEAAADAAEQAERIYRNDVSRKASKAAQQWSRMQWCMKQMACNEAWDIYIKASKKAE